MIYEIHTRSIGSVSMLKIGPYTMARKIPKYENLKNCFLVSQYPTIYFPSFLESRLDSKKYKRIDYDHSIYLYLV